jgi:hypothetical protein
MQALKKELGLLVPSLKVFLDIENLSSVADLELAIENSEVVLIFLSKGYFCRWNCLRESRKALVDGKEMVLMREVAKIHGKPAC